MRRLGYKIICVVLAFVSGVTVTQVKRGLLAANTSSVAANPADTDAAAEESQLTPQSVDPERPADFLVAENPWTHDDYTIERKSRKAQLGYVDGPKASPVKVDVYYVVVKKGGKTLGGFDADVYFGLGNSANFGMFTFLGIHTQQLFISQDVPRGGCQWVVSLSPGFGVIFDGRKYAIGREGYDLAAMDLDGDGVKEITAPITDFYSFHDKLSMSQIPLPTIIFKYDANKGEYLPANHHFQTYSLDEARERDELDSTDQTFVRATVLHRLLVYVYAGMEKEAWEFYDRTYKLDDKEEIRRRVKSILRNQPVYKFIYNQRRRKS